MYINNVGALRDVIEYHLSAAMLLKAPNRSRSEFLYNLEAQRATKLQGFRV